jgi:hypothetical protein
MPEPEVDVLKRDEAPDEARGGDDERHRERDFRDDQQGAQRSGGRRFAAAVAERLSEIAARAVGHDPPSRLRGAWARRVPGLTPV